MRLYLSRWVCLDVESNLHRLKEEICRAAMDGASIAVLPELFLGGYQREVDPAIARESFASASRAFPELLCVFGSHSEEGVNRLTAWRAGEEIAHYDKVHLFHPNREHEMWSPGHRLAAVELGGLRVGFLLCNDIRYPEAARALRMDARCDLLIVPAWWPWRRDHIWRALLQARAIENAMWVAGVSVSASVYPGEEFAGAGNYVFDPVGDPVPTLDDRSYRLNTEHPPRLVVDPLEHPSPSCEMEFIET